MPAPKVLLIGLPGVGKTTVATMVSEDASSTLLSVDARVKDILNAYMTNSLDPLYQNTLEELRLKFINLGCNREAVNNAFKRKDFPKHSSAFMKCLGELFWRQVEATIAALLLENESDCMFDLGASQIFNSQVNNIIKQQKFLVIYLEADEETILNHLSYLQENGQSRWKQISNYQEAEDWKKLVAEHRHIRMPLYEQIADIKVNVSGLSIREVMHKVDDILSEKCTPSHSMHM